MNRRSIWAALFAVCSVKAQTPKGVGGACPDENGIGRPCKPGEKPAPYPRAIVQHGKQLIHLRADACPVCGTLAEPYVRPIRVVDQRFVPCDPPAPENSNVACFKETTAPHGPTEQVTRCRVCNAAFWQDAS
jgi:hypothetical protein